MVDNDKCNDATITEIQRLIKAFKSDFKAKTSDVEKFISINELESRWT